ncbi:MAG: heme lyase CcmF/NrfE family subunit [Rhodocyclaceae bacterium]
MLPELGHFLLIVAFLVALALGTLPLLGLAHGQAGLVRMARPAARLGFALTALCFVCLTLCFVGNDFSVLYVASHSNTRLPLVYRITAVWGSHEGSLLLWALMLSLWTCLLSFTRALPETFVVRALAVLGLVSAGFLVFMLFTSNPFVRIVPPLPEGQDLNPLLQDPGMIVHPPLLYMGYVGFSVAFALAVAALLEGRPDSRWALAARPWTLMAWVFLTLGILIGAGWAYYELGWGGWWFWDPVENASFMPWLVGTALLHSLAVSEKRGVFKSWTILLAIAAFSLSLLGTFLVRSGVLTSVHAFSSDPSRGLFILVLLVLVVGASLTLYAWRAPLLADDGRFALLSRETLLLLNNVLLAVAAASILLGTLYPLLADALAGTRLSVGPPYFEAVFVPLMAPVVVLMMVGPMLRWKRHAADALWQRIVPALLASGTLGCGAAFWTHGVSWRSALGLSLAAWVLIASAQQAFQRRPGKHATAPRGWWGMWLAHCGVGIFIIGVTMVKTHESSLDTTMQIGTQADLSGYTLQLENVREVDGPNYVAARASIAVTRHGEAIAMLSPERRLYAASQMPMTESSIDSGIWRDLYAALGEPQGDSWTVRIYHKPFIAWLWAGGAMMAIGGLLAASDPRYRKRARQGGISR